VRKSEIEQEIRNLWHAIEAIRAEISSLKCTPEVLQDIYRRLDLLEADSRHWGKRIERLDKAQRKIHEATQ
jgi:DNA repair ATPase RecN